MGDEMVDYIVGPVSAQAFLDDFFPTDQLPHLGTVKPFTRGCYESASCVTKEPLFYPEFVSQFS